MRELKFRAWKNLKGKMERVVVTPFSAINYGREHPDAPIFHADDVNDIRDFMPDADIVEQYTGLKDKNGKEIYEGDIVGFKWTKRLYIVTYRIYDASFILENDEWEEAIHLSLDKDDFEVFGNIHENPELLEKEK